jgi:hypothetical protein
MKHIDDCLFTNIFSVCNYRKINKRDVELVPVYTPLRIPSDSLKEKEMLDKVF